MLRHRCSPFQVEVAAHATDINAALREEIARCDPDHRRIGMPTSWQRKSALEGKISAATALPFVLGEALADGTPTERIVRLIRAPEAVVRRLRGEEPVLDVSDAFGRETLAESAANPLQHEVLVTRSVGAMRRCRDGLLAQRDRTDAAIRALDRAIHDVERGTAHVRGQLGLGVSA